MSLSDSESGSSSDSSSSSSGSSSSRVDWRSSAAQERRRRDDRDRSRDRETELERRRREREKRHAEREEREQRGTKRGRSGTPQERREPAEEGEVTAPSNDEDIDYLRSKKKQAQEQSITTRTGGAYIPPARLRMMQAAITDKVSKEFQRLAWEALKKSINGLINKINVSNLVLIVRELFSENIVRGRGLLARAVITAQTASPTFTHVYAALVAIINTKFPQIGELILKPLVLQFKKSLRRNDKNACLASVRFVAHLVNQQVAHEIAALEILFLLLQNPTDDSVELAVGFLQEVGQKLGELSPKGVIGVFERLRSVLHEAKIEKRTQYMIEVMFQVRKDGFKDHPAVIQELDLVEEDEQFTHNLRLEDAVNSEDALNVFKYDLEYEETESKYKELKREILDEGTSDESGGSSGSSSSSESDDDEEGGENKEGEQKILDMTETNLVAFRRTVYLTIQSSLDFEECAHKLLKIDIKPGWEMELCNMMLDCCGQQRTYEKFFGLLAQRFCMIDRKYVAPFQDMFREQYETVHRMETNKLRNVGKFFSHLLHTDAISWMVLEIIKMTEDDTTSSSRIFIKVLFQDLSEYMGLAKLNDRLTDATLSPYFEGLFPRDSPKNTRFAINFFTSIGLGGLTDELRAHLKTMPKPVPQVAVPASSSSSTTPPGRAV